jgi:transformer-2 protein
MSNRRRHVGTREAPPESQCLGVFGLSLYTTERELEKEFSRFGPLEKVQIILDGKVREHEVACAVHDCSRDADYFTGL